MRSPRTIQVLQLKVADSARTRTEVWVRQRLLDCKNVVIEALEIEMHVNIDTKIHKMFVAWILYIFLRAFQMETMFGNTHVKYSVGVEINE